MWVWVGVHGWAAAARQASHKAVSLQAIATALALVDLLIIEHLPSYTPYTQQAPSQTICTYFVCRVAPREAVHSSQGTNSDLWRRC
jgi:hypothetical protein